MVSDRSCVSKMDLSQNQDGRLKLPAAIKSPPTNSTKHQAPPPCLASSYNESSASIRTTIITQQSSPLLASPTKMQHIILTPFNYPPPPITLLDQPTYAPKQIKQFIKSAHFFSTSPQCSHTNPNYSSSPPCYPLPRSFLNLQLPNFHWAVVVWRTRHLWCQRAAVVEW